MNASSALSQVPAVTLGFWIIKILATTLGETAGDTVSMTMKLGYLIGTAIFLSALVVLVVTQILAKKFHPTLYWATITASTTAGTTMADFADRSLGVGYPGGALILAACVLASLGFWRWSEGSVSVDTVNTPKVELSHCRKEPEIIPERRRNHTGAERSARAFDAQQRPVLALEMRTRLFCLQFPAKWDMNRSRAIRETLLKSGANSLCGVRALL
jgi:hypothetical protein